MPARLVSTVAACALSLAALSMPAASSAGQIDFGVTHERPNPATDDAGNGYFTFADGEVLKFCKAPTGDSACSTTKTFPEYKTFPEDFGNYPIAAGNQVEILDSRYNGETVKLLYSPTDNYTTPSVIASDHDYPYEATAISDALFIPAGTLSAEPFIATTESGPITDGGYFQATTTLPNTHLGAFRFSLLGAEERATTDESLALSGSTLLGAFVDQSTGNKVEWRKYAGKGNVTELDNSGKWSTPQPFGDGSSAVQLAGGPGGIYAAYNRASDDAVVLQKFNGSGWDGPTVLAPADTEAGFALSEDSAGVLHFAWQEVQTGHLRYEYGRSSANAEFTYPQDLGIVESFNEPKIVVDAAGDGWVTWRTGNGHGIAQSLAPGEGTPPGGGGTAPEYKGPSQSKSASLGHGLAANLTTPKNCVPGGDLFKARVAVKRKGSSRHKISYTVKQVKFYLGRKLVSTDKKKPFEVAFATAGLGAGAKLAVSAKISVNLHVGPRRHSKVTKTLKASVKTCG